MSSLEQPETAEQSVDEAPQGVTVTVEDGELAVSIPDDATASEAAAITAAVGAHVTDRQRAAAAAAASRQTVEYVDDWKLAGRLERFGKQRRPENVERGDEWKAAARARY
ncbi:hypothetical protein NDI85_02395 [Halomicroarcula sp. S1AR25-4]|uniref:hypothetical protein n=1 Tax=Haloarcula sp. S1AR25-4 TaxID=2950538 RepID=UPI0028742F51|nr:hypothetical protein [Halomicroarcula sp. S1AR25-4]MDS0276629.1 hypothetical protein [Halomicroarcula sp. S1AR25-4]